MKQVLSYLNQLGFSEIEAKLYLKLLISGSMTVAELAQVTKINRTAAYGHINSLLEKGNIAKVKGSANKIAANPPEHLYFLVEQKAIQVGMLQEQLPTIISSLNSSLPQIKSANQGEMRYYKGRSGVKKIYAETLNTKEIRSYANAEEIAKAFPDNYQLLKNAFQSNPNIKIFEIYEESPESRKRIKFANKNHLYKVLPGDIKLTANDILIYDGKVAIINIADKDNITGIVLYNKEYYENSKQIFDLLWRLLPAPSLG